MTSPSLNKLYLDLLVSKNKLSLLKNYYSEIKNQIVDKLNALYQDLINDVEWVDSKISDLAIDKSDALTAMSDFISNSEDTLIVNHPKYTEMMDKYNSLISNFYSRMIALKAGYEDDFVANEIGSITADWKFHYSENYGDATSVVHEFGPLNFTSESKIFELTNNRFIYMTNENIVYDVDYVSKNVYIINIDSKIFASQYNNLHGANDNYFGNERAYFQTLFRLNGRNKIYALVNIGDKFSDLRTGDVIGDSSDTSPVQDLVVCEYDPENHKFIIMNNTNTSRFLIKGSLLDENEITFIDGKFNDYFYYYIGKFLVRCKIDGTSSENVGQHIVGESSINIVSAIIDSSSADRTYLIITTGLSNIGIYDINVETIDFSSPTIRSFDMQSLASQFASSEEGVIQNMFFCNNIGGLGAYGLYIVTDRSIWFTQDRFNTIVKDGRINYISIQNLSFTNRDEYLIDEFGYIYVLGNNAVLYCAKTSRGSELQDRVAESPTRYADKIMNISNLVTTSQKGYIFSTNTDITKAQSTDVGGEEFIYTFTENGVFYGITSTGKITKMSIIKDTEKHLKTKHSVCGDKTITAIYFDDERDVFYFATEDYNVYYIYKSDVISNIEKNAGIVGDVSIGTRINCMIMESGTLYLGCRSGEICAYSITIDEEDASISGKFHTTISTMEGYDEEDPYKYHINKGSAIGNVEITCMLIDSSNLIVCGNNGHVASCALKSNVWTSFEGKPDNASAIDSNIYFDGVGLNGKNIVAAINYAGSRLVIIGEGAYVASCNLSTGNWSNYKGETENHGKNGVGPGVFNNGTLLGGMNPTSAIRVGTIIYVAGESGRMASINVLTGGCTEYRGDTPEINDSVKGPGFNYQGNDLNANEKVTSMCSDTEHSIIILSGTNSFILSYSPSSYEVLSPTKTKLYYIARRQSDYDYLSSLLVRVSKGTLDEFAPLYPPSEENSVFDMAYESSYYVYQNGDFIWRISTSYDKIYFSNNGGVTYTSKPFIGEELLPSILTNTVRFMPSGYCSKSGKLGFVTTVATESFYIFGTTDGENFSAEIYNSPHTMNQKELNSFLMIDEDSSEPVFAVKENGKYVLIDSTGRTIENVDYYDGGYALSGDKFQVALDDNPDIFAAVPAIKQYLSNVLGINDEIKVNQFFMTGKTDVTFIVIIGKVKLAMVTFSFTDVITQKIFSIDSQDSYTITSKVFNLEEAKFENAKGLYTSANAYETDVTKFEIDPESMYTCVDYKGLNGFIGFDVKITSDNYSYIKNRHILINVSCDTFGESFVNDSKVINVSPNKGKMFEYDKSKNEIQIAYYSTLSNSNVIKHTNSIHRYSVAESIKFTPMRALSDAWKSCQINMAPSTINSFAIRLKMRNTQDVSFADVINKQFTLRYQVLITNITKGNYILYEVEKSTGISKTDDETKVVEPFFRVITIDGFEDDIMELYTSRMDNSRRTSFAQKMVSGGNDFVGQINSRIESTYDFLTYVQEKNPGATANVYQVKIKPLNTLPANVDAEFFVEPYLSPVSMNRAEYTSSPVKTVFNEIDKSEFNVIKGEVNNTAAFIFGNPKINGFLTKSQLDIGHMTKHPFISNPDYLPQYDERETDVEVGFADTYVTIVRGKGDGLYDRMNGIISNTGVKWELIPLSVNKEDIKFSFDEEGSSNLQKNSDVKLLKNTRGIHKMHNFSVFSKGVTNNADYYTDYDEGKGRIVRVEGTMSNPYGLFEVVSTLDGNQKRINKLSEVRENGHWRTNENAYDAIKKRIYGKSYDFIDRFSIFEDPYYAIQAWWIPAQGYITKGNERFLTYSFKEGSNTNGTVGRKYLPFDTIEAGRPISKAYTGAVTPSTSGVVSALYGVYNENKVVAIRDLIDEKFPLERWDGFEFADLCFIRKWRTVYTDDSIEYTYELESPRIENLAEPTKPTLGKTFVINCIPVPGSAVYNSIPTEILSPKPSIPRNLYSYWDDFDYEGRGKQILKCCTAYYYTSHDWKIYKHEVQENVYDWTTEQKEVAKTYIAAIEDNNFARKNLVSSTVTENLWYCPVTNNVNTSALNHDNLQYSPLYPKVFTEYPKVLDDRGIIEFNNFPRDKDFVVGERLTKVYAPVVDGVFEYEVKPPYEGLSYTSPVNAGSIKTRSYLRGVYKLDEVNIEKQYEEGSDSDNIGMVDITTVKNINNGIFTEMNPFVVNLGSDDIINATALTNKKYDNISKVSFGNAGSHLTNIGLDSSANKRGWFNAISGMATVLAKKDGSKYSFSSKNDGTVTWDNTYYRYVDPKQTNDFNTDNSVFRISILSYKAKADGDINTNFGITTVQTNDTTSGVNVTAESYVYDKYIGSCSYKYLFGRKRKVTITLKYTYNGSSDTSTKCKKGSLSTYIPYTNDYYEFTSIASTGSGSFTETDVTTSFITSRHRAPDNKPTADLVDKFFIGNDSSEYATLEEIDGVKRITRNYNYYYFYNNGTRVKVVEQASSKYKWIVIDGAVVIPTDTTGETLDNYKVECKELYEWNDGYVHTQNVTRTVKELKELWGITVTVAIDISNNGTNYIAAYKTKFVGPRLTHTTWVDGSNDEITITSVNDIKYTSTASNMGETNPANVTIWTAENGENNGISTEATYDIIKTLSNCNLSNTDSKIGYHTPYYTTVTATSGYTLPNSITVKCGSVTLDSNSYSYEKATNTSAALTIYGPSIEGNITIAITASK